MTYALQLKSEAVYFGLSVYRYQKLTAPFRHLKAYFFTKKGKAILVLNDPEMLRTSSKPSISHRVFFTLSGICLALFIITLILF